MAFKGVKLRFEVAQVPETDRFVRRPGGQDGFSSGIEGDRVDGITMLAVRNGRRTVRLGLTDVKDLKGDIIRHRANEGRVKRVVLDIIDNRCVMGVGSGGLERFVALLEGRQIPDWSQSTDFTQQKVPRKTHQRRTVLSSLPVTRCPAE